MTEIPQLEDRFVDGHTHGSCAVCEAFFANTETVYDRNGIMYDEFGATDVRDGPFVCVPCYDSYLVEKREAENKQLGEFE